MVVVDSNCECCCGVNSLILSYHLFYWCTGLPAELFCMSEAVYRDAKLASEHFLHGDLHLCRHVFNDPFAGVWSNFCNKTVDAYRLSVSNKEIVFCSLVQRSYCRSMFSILDYMFMEQIEIDSVLPLLGSFLFSKKNHQILITVSCFSCSFNGEK